MDPRLQQRVQRYGWDKAAALYEEYWSAQLAPAQDLLMTLAQLGDGERVLDVACGTGLVTFRAAEAVRQGGSVLATDISEKMIERLLSATRDRHVTNVTAIRSEAEVLQFADDSFDAVLCSLGLMYVTDPVASLRQMLRALRPGGRAVASVWGERAHCGWSEVFPIVDSRVRSEVCPLFFQLGTGETLSITMQLAGFSNIIVQRIATTLRYATMDAACGAAFEGGPVALAFSRFDEQTRQEACAEYRRSIEPYRRDGAYEIPGEFVVARGTRDLKIVSGGRS